MVNTTIVSLPAPAPASYSLAELCVFVGMPVRTVRYYVQIGLVDRPEGETRAARYGARQLEQLLLIKKWSASGVSLDRIREVLHGAPPPLPPRAKSVGAVSVRSHLTVVDGVEIVIDPAQAGLSPEQVRQLVSGVMEVFSQINQSGVTADPSSTANTASDDIESKGERKP